MQIQGHLEPIHWTGKKQQIHTSLDLSNSTLSHVVAQEMIPQNMSLCHTELKKQAQNQALTDLSFFLPLVQTAFL